MTTSALHLFCGFTALCLLPLTSGCIWRTSDTDHFWGPTFIRANQPPQGKAYLWEEHPLIPLVLEGGGHMALTIGFLRHLAANPVERNKQAPLQWCSGLLSTSCSTPSASDGWLWSFLYSRITHHSPPEFNDRSVSGVSFGAGSNGHHAILGYSSDTRHKPQDNAYYIFCYSRNIPLQTRFEITRHTTEFNIFLGQEVCQ